MMLMLVVNVNYKSHTALMVNVVICHSDKIKKAMPQTAAWLYLLMAMLLTGYSGSNTLV